MIAALLLYECRGNIGQLVADIQMICAEGFLEYKVKGTDEVRIEVPALPDYIYKGLLNCRRGGSAFLDYICAGDEYYYFQNQQNVI
ncbi:hypothetical protein GM543_14010, partial [Streptococcus pneumoniae]